MALAANGMKRCGTCQEMKAVQEYHRNRSRPDGLHVECKWCTAIRLAKWRWDNPEKRRAQGKRKYSLHKVKMSVAHATWHAKNWERIAVASRKWKKENPERDRVLRQRARLSRRARKHKAFVETIDRQVVFIYNEGICGICHKPIEGAFHLDHIKPLAKGGKHSYDNVQVAHPKCNRMKGAKYGVAA